MSAWTAAGIFRLKPNSWWIGKRVRLTRRTQRGDGTVYRKGRIATVQRKFGGLTLKGRQLYITRVNYGRMEVEQ